MKALGKKILAVMSDVEPLSKDAHNEFHDYDYVSAESVIRGIRKSLIKNALVVIPNHVGETHEGDLTRLTVEYTLIDTDSGESIKTSVVSYGSDKTDKGIYKATTGNAKSFFTKTFMIPLEDDPEPEHDDAHKTLRKPLVPHERPTASISTFTPEPSESVMVNEILAKLIELNSGDEKGVSDDLRKLTSWKDKSTGEEKWLKIPDLQNIAQRKPEWIQKIHAKVFQLH